MAGSILLGVLLGASIGGAFAWFQLLALHRNELLQRHETLPGWLRQVPSSVGRVTLLLMALIVVQVAFPSADKWWLSGALAAAYGVPFFRRLNERRLLSQR
jgi:hypothetical protein